ncbi:Thioredoxin family protein [Cryptosporidium felis]|nr:Thioredoxin family protein [Cryptosporidium felis]
MRSSSLISYFKRILGVSSLFERKRLFFLPFPFKYIIQNNIKQNKLNKRCFFSEKSNNCLIGYSLFFIIKASVIAVSYGYYLNNISKKININKISLDEIKYVSSRSKNVIIVKIPKQKICNDGYSIEQLIEKLDKEEIDHLGICTYFIEDSSIQSVRSPNITLYKNFGKIQNNLGEVELNEAFSLVKHFFTPTLNTVPTYNQDNVKDINLDTFENEVINKSSKSNPLLLLYFDNKCLMCFLIRPLINTLACDLKSISNIQFARYNIEENDIHEFSPNISATPTFVLFQGDELPEKWDEYKPKDIIEKIAKILCKQSKEEARHHIDKFKNLEEKILLRFQLFTLVNLWQFYLLEFQSLMKSSFIDNVNDLSSYFENLLSLSNKFLDHEASFSRNVNCAEVDFNNLLNYKNISNFKEILSENISKDMKKSDTIEENICYLLGEIREYCTDYLRIRGLTEY